MDNKKKRRVAAFAGLAGRTAGGSGPFAGGWRAGIARSVQSTLSPTGVAARVDVISRSADGRPIGVGVQAHGGTRQVLFSGGF